MTLGGRSFLPVLLAALAAAMAAGLLLVGPALVRVANVVPALVLAALIVLRLRDAGYAWTSAAAISACLFAQPQLAPMLARIDGPVWLSLAVFAIFVGAVIERANVRVVIALGASLALVQIIDPIGAFLVAAAVPLLALQPGLRRTVREAVTFAMLILFIPAMVAVMLAQFGLYQGSAMPPLPTALARLGLLSASIPAGPSLQELAVGGSALVPALALPLLWPSLRGSTTVVGIVLGFAVAGAFAVAALFGVNREAYWLAAALLPIAAVLYSSLKPVALREPAATIASLLSLALSWAIWVV